MKSEIYRSRLIMLAGGLVLFQFAVIFSYGQNLDVAYVPTPDSIVKKMLDMAKVGPGDYLIDLGCGDGRIVIAAAKRGAMGYGVDLDPQRIEEARTNAEVAGVADKVVFAEQNIYDTNISRATVIAMYLFPSINLKLRPLFLKNLEPGTRIVSHDFGMDEWRPDQQYGRMENHAAYLWIVPAQVEGNWKWSAGSKEFRMNITQEFQEIEIDLRSEEKTFSTEKPLLSGKRISFAATDDSGREKYVFCGKVENEKMEGVVQIHKGETKSIENCVVIRSRE